MILSCPECRQQVQVPENLRGQPARCPHCGAAFTTPIALPHEGVDAPAAPSVAGSQETCPGCGRPVRPEEEQCPHCGESLFEEDRPWDEPGGIGRLDSEPHRGRMILTLGVVSLVLCGLSCCCFPGGLAGVGLGVTTWKMGNRDLAKMQANQMDRRGRSATQTGRTCGLVAIWVGLLWFLVSIGLQFGRVWMNQAMRVPLAP